MTLMDFLSVSGLFKKKGGGLCLIQMLSAM